MPDVTGEQVKRVTVEDRADAVEALRLHLYNWWASYVPPAVMASWTHDVDLFEAAVREDERERALVLADALQGALYEHGGCDYNDCWHHSAHEALRAEEPQP